MKVGITYFFLPAKRVKVRTLSAKGNENGDPEHLTDSGLRSRESEKKLQVSSKFATEPASEMKSS